MEYWFYRDERTKSYHFAKSWPLYIDCSAYEVYPAQISQRRGTLYNTAAKMLRAIKDKALSSLFNIVVVYRA